MYIKLIREQLKLDRIGKDAFRGVTLSYTWLANQFGHFSLGFVPVIILNAILKNLEQPIFWTYLVAFLVWVGWFIFEIYNYGSTISKSQDSLFFYGSRKLHFYYDLVLDLIYFAFGGVFAMLVIEPSMVKLLGSILLFSILFFMWPYWYLSKIYLQRALYPFQFRLSQWTKPLSPENIEKIEKFMRSDSPHFHLLLFGEDDDSKIHLSVGIGSELSYDLIKCRYLTAMKIFESFYREDPKDNETSHLFSWNWQEAKFLIIDDINPSHADMAEVITTQEFYDKITHKLAEVNLKQLREKKVIWMLGNENHGNLEQKDWESLMYKIGIHPENVIPINLSEKPVKDTAPGL